MSIITSEDDICQFLSSDRSREDVCLLRKHDLRLLASHLEVSFHSNERKDDLLRKVCVKLFGETEVADGAKWSVGVRSDVEGDMSTWSIQQLELARLQASIELVKYHTAQEQAKNEQARINLEVVKLNNERELRSEQETLERFEVAQQVKLVPPFDDTDVTGYFNSFEKVAENLRWPRDKWTVLLQSVLKGSTYRCQAVYTALSVSQSRDYETVKDTILKAYEVVPEAYRLKFKNSYKEPGITHVEYMNDLDKAFERWLRSKEVGGDYNKLRSLILLENFS